MCSYLSSVARTFMFTEELAYIAELDSNLQSPLHKGSDGIALLRMPKEGRPGRFCSKSLSQLMP